MVRILQGELIYKGAACPGLGGQQGDGIVTWGWYQQAINTSKDQGTERNGDPNLEAACHTGEVAFGGGMQPA